MFGWCASLFLSSLLVWVAFLLSLPLGGHLPLSFVLYIVTLVVSFFVAPVGVAIGVVGMLVWGRENMVIGRTFRRSALCNAAVVAAGTVLYASVRWTAVAR